MSSVFTANQSDWSAFLNPDAEPLTPRKLAFPRVQSGAITRSQSKLDSSVMMSSVMPSAK